MSLLVCKDVALGYEGKPILEGLSLSIQEGDYICIVGENGSGKSTLMKAMLNLRPPLRGEILMGEGTKQTQIGYLPQQTAVQKDFPGSVSEIVLSGCLNRCGMRPFYNRAEKRLAIENMQRMGIGALSRRCYRELSGGQQQRVLLARALCAASKLLMLDEPVTGLDPNAAAELYDIISRLNREDGLTVIMISHDIGAATKYASHILHLGCDIPFFGTAEEYLNSKAGRIYASHGRR